MLGGQISRRSSLFSFDGQLLLAPCGNNINLYGAATSELAGALEGHTDEVMCLALNPNNTSQVYSGSRDGTLRLWDIATQTCLKVLPVREPVRAMVIHSSLNLAYLSIEWRDGMSGRVICYRLDRGRAGATAMKSRAAGPLAMASPQGGLVATIDRHSLFVWRAAPEISQPLNLHHTRPYTCLALSPDETMLAAGDVSGRIMIWRGLEGVVPKEAREGAHQGKARAEVPPPVTTLHWHAGPVLSLAFSSDGTTLLSGGREGVLVLWNTQNHRPTFLPRLGGPITGISRHPADPASLLLRQSDNTLRVVSLASMKVETSVLGLKPRPTGTSPEEGACATALQPATGLLAVPAPNATLQLFDTVHQRHVSQLKVAPRNQVSTPLPLQAPGQAASAMEVDGGEAAAALAAAAAGGQGYDSHSQPRVTRAAFSHDGRCLVTVDVRPDAGPYGSSESALKFWDSAPGKNGFTLNTRVDDPHRGPVTALATHPSADMVVTCGGAAAGAPGGGMGGGPEFRVWERMAAPRRPGSQVEAPTCWRCRAVGAYQSVPLTAAAFSQDGSILAVAAQHKVTLWDPMTNTLAAVLPAAGEQASGAQQQQYGHGHAEGGKDGALHTLAFVPGTPFLVGATACTLVVWNLLTSTVHWSLPLSVSSLSADPAHPVFAVSLTHKALAAAAGGAAPQQQLPAQEGADPALAEAPEAAPAAADMEPEPPSTPAAGAVATLSPEDNSQNRLPGSGSGAVVVFSPLQPAPLLAARVPASPHTALLFVTPSMPQHAQLQPSSPPSDSARAVSPLLVLNESRAFSYLEPEGGSVASSGAEDAAQVPDQAPQAAQAHVSAFEAAFGALAVAPSKAGAEGEDGAGAGGHPGGVPRWRALLDAPSHALPPPTMLANAFLTLLTQQQ